MTYDEATINIIMDKIIELRNETEDIDSLGPLFDIGCDTTFSAVLKLLENMKKKN